MPHFLLLDEPFSGIDPIQVLELQRIIFDLKRQGIGVLVTDHNVRETLLVTDRAYIINNGRIFRAGSPEALGRDPEVKRVYLGESFSLGSNQLRIDRVEFERVLAWRSEDGNWVWTFVLEPRDGRTRLVSRNRFRLPNTLARIVMLPMEPASLVMERKMLLGIKQRAERLRTEA